MVKSFKSTPLPLLLCYSIFINRTDTTSRSRHRDPQGEITVIKAVQHPRWRNESFSIPPDLLQVVQDFMINDFKRLQLAFPCPHGRALINEGQRTCISSDKPQCGTSSRADLKVQCNTYQQIVKIQMQCAGLSKCNVWELPPGLKCLILNHGDITRVDLTRLPKGLEYLDLDHNRLLSVDLRQLPRGLRLIRLAFNQLSSLNLTALPESLEELHIACNTLTKVDFSKCPKGLKLVSMGGNLIHSVIIGECKASIYGARERCGESKYMEDDE